MRQPSIDTGTQTTVDRWIISRAQYDALAAECKVHTLAGDAIKILETPNGSFIKLFKLKSLLSSGLVYPYNLRFAHNAVKLRTLGVPSIESIQTFFVPRIMLQCAIYTPLPGLSLIDQSPSHNLITALARFVADLHHRGIYFRSLHLGNVITLPAGGFGLIDVSGMHFKGRPLRPSERVRNFHHLFRREDNRVWYGKSGATHLMHEYEKAAADFDEVSGNLTDRFLSLFDS